MSPRIAVFDNIIKIYLPVSYMGKEGADIADNLLRSFVWILYGQGF